MGRTAKTAVSAKVQSFAVQTASHNKTPVTAKTMRIVHLSDTHDVSYASASIPTGDLLIHSGDFTNAGDHGDPELVQVFVRWFLQQPHRYKILICGNHELGLDKRPKDDLRAYLSCDGPVEAVQHDFQNPVLLNDESVTIEGIHFYGSSWNHCSMAWPMRDEEARARAWSYIPADTDVLIPHQPPMGQLDLAWQQGVQPFSCGVCNGKKHRPNYCHWGCRPLLDAVLQRNSIALHCFGHVHDDHGFTQLARTQGGSSVATFSNAAMDIHQTPNLIDYSYVPAAPGGHKVAEQQEENVKKAAGKAGSLGKAPELPKRFQMAVLPRESHGNAVVDVDSDDKSGVTVIGWKALDPTKHPNQVWAFRGVQLNGDGPSFQASILSMDSRWQTTAGRPMTRSLALNRQSGKLECHTVTDQDAPPPFDIHYTEEGGGSFQLQAGGGWIGFRNHGFVRVENHHEAAVFGFFL